MSKTTAFFAYSIGKKIVMALTGLFLVSFLLVHLLGNLPLLSADGVTAFNEYTRFMTSSPLIKISEIILVSGFLLHIIFAILLTSSNKAARPMGYAYKKDSENSAWSSRNMGITGSIILVFLGLHLWMFWGAYKFGDGEMVNAMTAYKECWKLTSPVDVTLKMGNTTLTAGEYLTEEAALFLKDKQVRGISMYKVASDSFQNIFIVIFYVASMVLMGFHLNHGFQSGFRTLGLVHKKYTPLINIVGKILCVVVPAGFAIIPLYHLFFR